MRKYCAKAVDSVFVYASWRIAFVPEYVYYPAPCEEELEVCVIECVNMASGLGVYNEIFFWSFARAEAIYALSPSLFYTFFEISIFQATWFIILNHYGAFISLNGCNLSKVYGRA